MKKITPSANKHFKNIKTNDIYEGSIYLGKYDSEDNYIEVSEDEYQEYLKEINEVIEVDNGTTTGKFLDEKAGL